MACFKPAMLLATTRTPRSHTVNAPANLLSLKYAFLWSLRTCTPPVFRRGGGPPGDDMNIWGGGGTQKSPEWGLAISRSMPSFPWVGLPPRVSFPRHYSISSDRSPPTTHL